MAFWSDPSTLFPKQSHRWVVLLDDHIPEIAKGNTIPHYFAKSVDRPSYDIGVVQAKILYSHTFNFPKRVTWKPIKIEFYDILIDAPGLNNSFKNFVIDPILGNNYNMATPKDGIPTRYEKSGEHRRITAGGSAPRNVTTTVEAASSGGALITGNQIPGGAEYFEDDTGFYDKVTQEKLYQKSTQLFFYQFLQKCGYFNPNEIETPDKLLTFKSYNFKKNMVRAFSGQNKPLLNNNDQKSEKDYIVIKEIDGDGNTIEFWKIYNPIITDVSTGKLDYSNDGVMSITVGISYDWAELVPERYYSIESRKPATRYVPPVVKNNTTTPVPVKPKDNSEVASNKPKIDTNNKNLYDFLDTYGNLSNKVK